MRRMFHTFVAWTTALSLMWGGVIAGADDTQHEPVTRGEVARALVRAMDQRPSFEEHFVDTNRDRYGPYAERLRLLGVTNGCATDPPRFCPDDLVTRAEMAAFLSRAFKLPDSPSARFEDVTGDHLHFDHINSLVPAQITAGCGNGANFCPNDPVTEYQLNLFIQRARQYAGLSDDPGPGYGGNGQGTSSATTQPVFSGGGGGGSAGGGGGSGAPPPVATTVPPYDRADYVVMTGLGSAENPKRVTSMDFHAVFRTQAYITNQCQSASAHYSNSASGLPTGEVDGYKKTVWRCRDDGKWERIYIPRDPWFSEIDWPDGWENAGICVDLVWGTLASNYPGDHDWFGARKFSRVNGNYDEAACTASSTTTTTTVPVTDTSSAAAVCWVAWNEATLQAEVITQQPGHQPVGRMHFVSATDSSEAARNTALEEAKRWILEVTSDCRGGLGRGAIN